MKALLNNKPKCIIGYPLIGTFSSFHVIPILLILLALDLVVNLFFNFCLQWIHIVSYSFYEHKTEKMTKN